MEYVSPDEVYETPEFFLPLVETIESNESSSLETEILGTILEDGGLPIASVGFLLSHSPDFNESERIEVEFLDDSNQTFALSDTTADDEIIYIRAFATNSLAESLGQIIKISPPEKDIISSLSWFGEFLSYENQWIFHTRLGWLYLPTPIRRMEEYGSGHQLTMVGFGRIKILSRISIRIPMETGFI